MAKKARDGFREEMKGLLSAHGVKQLSDITDPAEDLTWLDAEMQEAIMISY